MVSLYGSDAGPKELFSTSVLPYFYKTITETIPRVWELNTLFLGLLKLTFDLFFQFQ